MKENSISAHVSRMARKVLDGSATPEERAFVEKYDAYFDQGESPTERMPEEEREALEKEILERIINDIHEPDTGKSLLRRHWLQAAAAVIILLVTAWWVLDLADRDAGVDNRKQEHLVRDVRPGGNKAVLTLGNGKQIELDNLSGGVAEEGDVAVRKEEGGLLTYEALSSEVSTAPVFHELSTPRGGIYRLELPDGTQVWLNSQTSIRYSVGYVGGLRVVELSGEAYFDVSTDVEHPFVVKVENRMHIEVTGTQFNVNAYPDEVHMKTSLVEGSVKVRSEAAHSGVDAAKRGQEVILSPGQQASMERAGHALTVQRVDVDEVTAWQKGLFLFKSANVATVLRQIARWYDVEIVYKSGVPDGHITGKIHRYEEVSEVLEILKLSGINVKIEGGKVVVM